MTQKPSITATQRLALPRRRSGAFASLDATVPAAREFVTETLRQWGLPHLAGDASVIVSEMATNVHRHTKSPEYSVKVIDFFDHVSVGVWDDSREIPRIEKNPDPLSETGRGWVIISSLSARSGITPDRLNGGKLAWAHLPKNPHGKEAD